jgi:hypothetical protein
MRRPGIRILALLAFLPLIGSAAGLAQPDASSRVPLCTRAAAPNGSDEARGTLRRPFRTADRLVSALRPGDVGCLAGGVYDGVTIRRGGRPEERITLRSAPGTRATIRGIVEITDSANYVTVSDVSIDGAGSSQQTVQVWGDFVTIRRVVVTNRGQGGSCIHLGSRDYGMAVAPRVERSRLHDCGNDEFHHGIYADSTRGAVIVRNYVYSNPGWGLHLYKDADNTRVEDNVFDGERESGILIGGDESDGRCLTSDDNVIRGNILTFSTKHGVDEWWGCTPGKGNVAVRNCLWGNASGPFDSEFEGYVARGNRIANPRFVDRAKADFRLRRGSGCAGMGPGARSR